MQQETASIQLGLPGFVVVTAIGLTYLWIYFIKNWVNLLFRKVRMTIPDTKRNLLLGDKPTIEYHAVAHPKKKDQPETSEFVGVYAITMKEKPTKQNAVLFKDVPDEEAGKITFERILTPGQFVVKYISNKEKVLFTSDPIAVTSPGIKLASEKYYWQEPIQVRYEVDDSFAQKAMYIWIIAAGTEEKQTSPFKATTQNTMELGPLGEPGRYILCCGPKKRSTNTLVEAKIARVPFVVHGPAVAPLCQEMYWGQELQFSVDASSMKNKYDEIVLVRDPEEGEEKEDPLGRKVAKRAAATVTFSGGETQLPGTYRAVYVRYVQEVREYREMCQSDPVVVEGASILALPLKNLFWNQTVSCWYATSAAHYWGITSADSAVLCRILENGEEEVSKLYIPQPTEDDFSFEDDTDEAVTERNLLAKENTALVSKRERLLKNVAGRQFGVLRFEGNLAPKVPGVYQFRYRGYVNGKWHEKFALSQQFVVRRPELTVTRPKDATDRYWNDPVNVVIRTSPNSGNYDCVVLRKCNSADASRVLAKVPVPPATPSTSLLFDEDLAPSSPGFYQLVYRIDGDVRKEAGATEPFEVHGPKLRFKVASPENVVVSFESSLLHSQHDWVQFCICSTVPKRGFFNKYQWVPAGNEGKIPFEASKHVPTEPGMYDLVYVANMRVEGESVVRRIGCALKVESGRLKALKGTVEESDAKERICVAEEGSRPLHTPIKIKATSPTGTVVGAAKPARRRPKPVVRVVEEYASSEGEEESAVSKPPKMRTRPADHTPTSTPKPMPKFPPPMPPKPPGGPPPPPPPMGGLPKPGPSENLPERPKDFLSAIVAFNTSKLKPTKKKAEEEKESRPAKEPSSRPARPQLLAGIENFKFKTKPEEKVEKPRQKPPPPPSNSMAREIILRAQARSQRVDEPRSAPPRGINPLDALRRRRDQLTGGTPVGQEDGSDADWSDED